MIKSIFFNKELRNHVENLERCVPTDNTLDYSELSTAVGASLHSLRAILRSKRILGALRKRRSRQKLQGLLEKCYAVLGAGYLPVLSALQHQALRDSVQETVDVVGNILRVYVYRDSN